jgi:UDP-N-acetylglucosamine 2-epimerase (non-hydrolysing)
MRSDPEQRIPSRATARPQTGAAADERRAQLVVPIVVGTRPEAIKLVPIIQALKKSAFFQPVTVSTGQHHHMVERIMDLAGIEIDVNLWAGAHRAELNERVATVMRRFDDFVMERWGERPGDEDFQDAVLAGKYPATVLVHGDTSSAMAAALSTFHLRIPVMHIEAGLRTGGLNLTPFPEELNRQVITCLASMHFAPTFENLENLVRENVEVGQIFVTGNTGVDALHWAASLDVPFKDPKVAALYEGDRPIIVVTAHRRENWGAGLASIAGGVARLAREHPELDVIVPLHPNPAVRETLGEPLREIDNILLTEPLEYAGFARLLKRCRLVITDSGGIQEEAPALGKPVLVARDSTERTEGVHAGTLLLVGPDGDAIFEKANWLLHDEAAYAAMSEAVNPYGDGHAAQRIVAALEHCLNGGDPPAPFGPGYERGEVLAAGRYEIRNRPGGTHFEPVSDAESRGAMDPWSA